MESLKQVMQLYYECIRLMQTLRCADQQRGEELTRQRMKISEQQIRVSRLGCGSQITGESLKTLQCMNQYKDRFPALAAFPVTLIAFQGMYIEPVKNASELQKYNNDRNLADCDRWQQNLQRMLSAYHDAISRLQQLQGQH